MIWQIMFVPVPHCGAHERLPDMAHWSFTLEHLGGEGEGGGGEGEGGGDGSGETNGGDGLGGGGEGGGRGALPGGHGGGDGQSILRHVPSRNMVPGATMEAS